MRYGWRVRQSIISGKFSAEIWVDQGGEVTCEENSPEFDFRGHAEEWGVGRAQELAESAPLANEITWVDA